VPQRRAVAPAVSDELAWAGFTAIHSTVEVDARGGSRAATVGEHVLAPVARIHGREFPLLEGPFRAGRGCDGPPVGSGAE